MLTLIYVFINGTAHIGKLSHILLERTRQSPLIIMEQQAIITGELTHIVEVAIIFCQSRSRSEPM